jgi:hypothetical protein
MIAGEATRNLAYIGVRQATCQLTGKPEIMQRKDCRQSTHNVLGAGTPILLKIPALELVHARA